LQAIRAAAIAGAARSGALIDSWKQRMWQMDFMEDATSMLELTDEDLKAFMKKYPKNYLIDPQLWYLHRND
jgi:tellurite resistance protein